MSIVCIHVRVRYSPLPHIHTFHTLPPPFTPNPIAYVMFMRVFTPLFTPFTPRQPPGRQLRDHRRRLASELGKRTAVTLRVCTGGWQGYVAGALDSEISVLLRCRRAATRRTVTLHQYCPVLYVVPRERDGLPLRQVRR